MAKIGIDCGHCTSGYDTSANGFRLESDLTREVGYKVISKFQALGHQVINCTVDHANSMNASLSRRCQIANDNGVDVYISIHFNCSESDQAHGTEVFCYKTGGKGEEYAKKVLNEMVALGYTNRGVKTANFYVLRNTNAPAILCECSFVSSKSDMDKYCADDFANAIVKGITGQTPNVSVSTKSQTATTPQPSVSMGVVQGINAIVVEDQLFARDNQGNKIGGYADINDKIKVLDVSYSKELALIEYPIVGGTKKAYVTNCNCIKYLNAPIKISGSKDVFDRFDGSKIGGVSNENVIILEDLGDKLNVVYSTDKGQWTKSGVIYK